MDLKNKSWSIRSGVGVVLWLRRSDAQEKSSPQRQPAASSSLIDRGYPFHTDDFFAQDDSW